MKEKDKYKADQNKTAQLIDQLHEYLQNSDLDEKLELKPKDEFYSNTDNNIKQEVDKELLEKDYSTKLDKQLDNIRL